MGKNAEILHASHQLEKAKQRNKGLERLNKILAEENDKLEQINAEWEIWYAQCQNVNLEQIIANWGNEYAECQNEPDNLIQRRLFVVGLNIQLKTLEALQTALGQLHDSLKEQYGELIQAKREYSSEEQNLLILQDKLIQQREDLRANILDTPMIKPYGEDNLDELHAQLLEVNQEYEHLVQENIDHLAKKNELISINDKFKKGYHGQCSSVRDKTKYAYDQMTNEQVERADKVLSQISSEMKPKEQAIRTAQGMLHQTKKAVRALETKLTNTSNSVEHHIAENHQLLIQIDDIIEQNTALEVSAQQHIMLDLEMQAEKEIAAQQEKVIGEQADISFKEFHRLFLAIFDETNSKGIQHVLQRLDELELMPINEKEKFADIGALMKTVALKRKDRFCSDIAFFGPGRSREARAFYLYAPCDKLSPYINRSDPYFRDNRFLPEEPKTFRTLIESIQNMSRHPGRVWEDLNYSFAEFCKEFKKSFQGTRSTGIKKIMKEMTKLENGKGDLRNNEQFKFTAICRIMHSVADERLDKKVMGRSDETLALYKLASSTQSTDTVQKNMADFIDGVLNLVRGNTNQTSGPRFSGTGR